MEYGSKGEEKAKRSRDEMLRSMCGVNRIDRVRMRKREEGCRCRERFS